MTTLPNVQNMALDMCRDYAKNIIVKQNEDNGRYIIIKCTEHGAFKFLDNSTMKCTVRILTPDKHMIYNYCEILDDGSVMVVLTPPSVNTSGIAKAELNVIDQNENIMVATMTFNIIIKPAVFDDNSIVSSDEFGVLTDLIAREKERIETVIELENLVKGNEAERNANEEIRKENEENRVTAETDRCSAENNRESSENERKQNENTRVASENTRIQDEEARKNSENIRLTAEQTRCENEEERIENENDRQNNESIRTSSEASRNNAELQRISNESERNTAEGHRINNENERISNELERKKNESERIDNETARVNAENQRLTDCATAVTNANSAADRANSAAESCESILNGVGTQNTFGTVSVGETDITASAPNDTLNIVAGENVSVSANNETNEIVVSSDKYIHPSGSGNNHVPPGGTSGQILEWKSSGTAKWADKPPHTKVKGNNEDSYRGGDVNLTPENIGAVSKLGDVLYNQYTFNGDTTIKGIRFKTINSGSAMEKNGNLTIDAKSNLMLQGAIGVQLISNNIWCANDSGGFSPIHASAFTVTSSRRAKTNITPMTEEEARKILDIDVVGYDYINGAKDQYGMIAEDVHKVIPNIVSGDVDCDDDDTEAVMNIGIDYSKAVPYLIKMVQMMAENDRKKDERIEVMEREIIEQNKQLLNLFKQLSNLLK